MSLHRNATTRGDTRGTTDHQSPAGDLAVRQGPWKRIFFKDERRELYNLGEKRDVAAHNGGLVAWLTQLMQGHIDRNRSTIRVLEFV